MKIKISPPAKALEKLKLELADLEKAMDDVATDLKSAGLPVSLVSRAVAGQGNLKLGSGSDVAKMIYKSREFQDVLRGIKGPQCIKARILFKTTKSLQAAFQEATLFGDVDVKKGEVSFKGYMFDRFDFRKSKVSKVKSTFGKALRALGNGAKELQDLGVLKPFDIRVDLVFKMKQK